MVCPCFAPWRWPPSPLLPLARTFTSVSLRHPRAWPTPGGGSEWWCAAMVLMLKASTAILGLTSATLLYLLVTEVCVRAGRVG